MTRAAKTMEILESDIDHLTLDEIAELAGRMLTYSNYRLDPNRLAHFYHGLDKKDLLEAMFSCLQSTESVSTYQSQLFSPSRAVPDDTSTPNVG